MSVPCNKQDFKRFQQLAELINNEPGAVLNIYTTLNSDKSGYYVHIEMSAPNAISEDVKAIFESR